MRAAAAVVVAGGALAAAAAAAPGGQEPVPTRDCSTRTEPSRGVLRFAEPKDVVVGPVSFTSLRLASSPRAGYRRRDSRLFVKAGVKVLWGPPVTVRVAAADADQLVLEYVGGPGGWQQTAAVRFEQCPPGTPMWNGNSYRRVTGFNGGLAFSRRGCYTLVVQAEGRRAYSREVSLGAGTCE